jgi:hypothetical protein
MSLFEKNIQHEYNYSRNNAVEPMFLTLFFQTKCWKQWSIQMTSGLLLEQELKKEEFLKTRDKGTYLAIKAAQDLLAKGNVDP